jgi:hypothetical protein
MVFSWPARILRAFSFHCFSASATFARYFIPIHLLVVLLGPWDVRNAHLAQTYRSGRTEARNREGDAMMADGVLSQHWITVDSTQ